MEKKEDKTGENIETFLKDELARYISQELANGYDIKVIKEALLKAGHDNDVIKEALDILNFKDNKAEENREKEELKRDMLDETIHSLKKYIKKQVENGYTIDEIKKRLFYEGHTKETIKQAIDLGLKNRGPWYVKNDKLTIILSFMGFIISLFILSGTTGEELSTVATGFYPALLSMLLAGVIIDKFKHLRDYIWFIPLFLGTIFYIFPILQRADVISLIILNLITAYVYIYVLFTIKLHKEEIELLEKEVQ